ESPPFIPPQTHPRFRSWVCPSGSRHGGWIEGRGGALGEVVDDRRV
ncbi:MAG: hypothetical protein AVDCRST_MAG91-1539, partial [uncultured Sphingomonadaceae bacterium]